jgi:hypothetical protein
MKTVPAQKTEAKIGDHAQVDEEGTQSSDSR